MPACSTACTRRCSASGRRPSPEGRKDYSADVVERAVALRPKDMGLSDIASRVSAEIAEAASRMTKDAVAALLRRQRTRQRGSYRAAGLDAEDGRVRAHDPAPRVQGRGALGPPRPQPRRRGRPARVLGPSRIAAQAWDAATLQRLPQILRRAGDRLYALWVVLATTGMRRGEALGLRWATWTSRQAAHRFVQTVIQVRGQVVLGEPKTAQGRRAIDLDTWTVAALRTHRIRMAEERLLVGPDFADSGLVFHDPSGAPLRPESVSRSFARRVAAGGLSPLTLHGLRHTWATLALHNGVHPRVVQERLGHVTIAITLGIYSHVSPTLHAQAAQSIADTMFGAVRPGSSNG